VHGGAGAVMANVWGLPGDMPPAVAAMHSDAAVTHARGMAQVDRGAGLVARILARIIGFPASALAVPLEVEITRDRNGETWTRSFAGQSFSSRMTRREGRVVEHFGPLAFAFDLAPVANGHAMHLARWWCGPIRLPLLLAPRIAATETDTDGRFGFDVRITLPLFGLLIAYRGSLVVAPKAVDPAAWSLSDERPIPRRAMAGTRAVTAAPAPAQR
jgi:Domain of unknown function (DUF4166)